MNDPTAAQQLQKLLLLSSTRDNPEQIKQVESYIQQNRLHEGFVPCLVQVITKNLQNLEGSSSCYHIVLASMVELKNVVRSHWHPFSNERCICHNDKEYFIGNIIDLSFRLYNLPNQAMSYKFSKLMKDVIEITRCSSIRPYKQIASIIQQSSTMQKFQRLPFCLNILLGWSFQEFSNSGDQVSAYAEMTRCIHPLLLDFLREGNNIILDMYDKLTEITDKEETIRFIKIYGQVKRKYEEILYMSIKLASKATCFDGIEQYREIAVEWADVAITKIRHQYVPEEYCENNQGTTGMGVKGNDRFNFYHGKKWALKFMNRFMQRVLVLKKKDPVFNQLTISFYQRNLETILDIFRQGWQIDQPQEIRYQQLRSFTTLVSSKYKYLSLHKRKEMELYLSKILPNFIRLTQKQLDVIQEDPTEFIINQGQPTIFTASVKGIRMMATDLWIRIAKLSEYLVVDEKNPMLAYSFYLIKSWTEEYSNDSNALILRDIGCYLLGKLTLQFQRVKPIKTELVDLLDRIIRDNMVRPLHFMYIARALDLANTYSRILPNALKEFMTFNIIQLYKNLQNCLHSNSPEPTQTFILIKSCLALQQIVSTIQLSQSDLFLIIFTNLQLIKITSFEDIMQSVDNLLDRYISIVPGFALQLITHIKNWFKEYARAQTSERVDYRKSESYLVLANGVMRVLTTLTKLCETKDQRIIAALESEIANISGFVLEEQEDIVVEYKEGATELMANYLFWYPTELPLTNIMRTLCKRHMIKMAGLQPHVIQQIDKLIQEMQLTGTTKGLKKLYIFRNCNQTADYDHQTYISFMHSYIKFIPYGEPIRSMREIAGSILSNSINQTELFMYVVYQVFTDGQSEQWINNKSTNTALVFLTLYYDSYQIQRPHAKVHQSVNSLVIGIIQQGLNVQIAQPSISVYLVQLFCMWMVEVREEMLGFFNNWQVEKVEELFNNVFICGGYYGLPQIHQNSQRARCIQGISVLLTLAVSNQQLWKFISTIIPTLIKYAIDFTKQILIPHKESREDLERWRAIYQANEKRKEEEMTMPEQHDHIIPNKKEEVDDEYDAPMVFQPHLYNSCDFSQDQQDLFQALNYNRYVCPVLQNGQYKLNLLQSLYLIFTHNQQYYLNILTDTYAQRLQMIACHNNLIDHQEYQRFVVLFDAYFGEFIDFDEDEEI